MQHGKASKLNHHIFYTFIHIRLYSFIVTLCFELLINKTKQKYQALTSCHWQRCKAKESRKESK